MGRLLHIGIVAFLGLSFILCTFFLYFAYQKKTVNGNRIMDETVNVEIKAEKIGIFGILVYTLMFIIAIYFAIQIVYKGAQFPSASSVLIRAILVVPIMALFHARRRTGKAVIVLVSSGFFLLFCTMTYMIIGLPVKAPVLTINDTEIRLGRTTVKDLMDDGFDVYIENGHTSRLDIDKFPDSEDFEKYTENSEVSVAKGYHRYATKRLPHTKGILAKNNVPIAKVTFYGSMTEDLPLKDCAIIHFFMRKKSIVLARESGISMKLNGADLLSEIETDMMKKIFGNRIFRLKDVEAEKRYIISWDSRSHHLFYNSYSAVIYMDDEYFMNELELECQIAREAD